MIVLNQVGQGTYWRAFHLARQLVQKGQAVTLMATSHHNRSGIIVHDQEGVTLVETPDLLHGSLRSGWDLWNTINRLSWLHGRKFDLVHAFESRPTVLIPALYLARRRGIPLVMDWCDWFGKGGSVEERPNSLVRTLLRPVETFFEERFRTQADGTTVICSLLHNKAQLLGVPQDQILDLPNGSDTQHLQSLPLASARLKIGLSSNDFVAGYVGRIFKRDAELMAKAFDLVGNEIPEFKMVIVGHYPYDIRRLVNRPENLILSGYVDTAQLNTYLAACDLFWLPLSDTNANRGRFPLKLTDYMAVGRPVVATEVGDVAKVLTDQSFGLLSRPEPEDFATQTLNLFRNPDLRLGMGAEARRLAETQFAWDHLATQLLDLYMTVISERAGGSR